MSEYIFTASFDSTITNLNQSIFETIKFQYTPETGIIQILLPD